MTAPEQGEQFVLEPSGQRSDGTPFPALVGPFESKAAAWRWWHKALIEHADPRYTYEANVAPLTRP